MANIFKNKKEYMELEYPEEEWNKPAKTKKFVSTVSKGAKEVGSRVAKGASSLAKKGYESYKQYTSPEAKQARLDKQEEMLARQARMAEQKARIRSLQQRGGGGGSFLGGFQGIDMQDVLGGGGISGGNFGGEMEISGGLGSGFDMIMGSRQPRQLRAMPRKRITRRTARNKKRVKRSRVRRMPARRAMFNPFDL